MQDESRSKVLRSGAASLLLDHVSTVLQPLDDIVVAPSTGEVSASAASTESMPPAPDRKMTEGLAGYQEYPSWSVVLTIVVACVSGVAFAVDGSRYVATYQRGENDAAAEKVAHKNPKRWIILAMCVASLVATDLYVSSPVTFYAIEAGRRGADQALVSLYISLYSLGGVMVTWFAPWILSFVAPNRLNRLSILLACFTAVTQGLGGLIDGPPPSAFVGYTCVLRAIEGIPSMLTEACAQTMILRSFPLDELVNANGVLQGSRAIAVMAGGPIAGFMYSAGGFMMPYTLGGIALLLAYVSIMLTIAQEKSLDATPENKSIWSVVTASWRVNALLASLGFGVFNSVYFASIVSPWLAAPPYLLQPWAVGLVQVLAMVSTIFGIILFSTLMGIVGPVYGLIPVFLCGIVGQLFMGPSPLICPSYPQEYGWALLAVGVSAIGGGSIVSVQPVMTWIVTVYLGKPRESFDAPIAATCTFVQILGAFVGPLITGVLLDRLGIASLTAILVGCQVVLTLLTVFAMWPLRHLRKLEFAKEDEAENAENAKQS